MSLSRTGLLMVGTLVATSLACGGVSVSPRAHLEPLCEATGPVFVGGPLVRADVAPRRLERGILVDIDRDGPLVDGMRVSWMDLGPELKTRVRTSAALGGRPRLQIAAQPDVNSAQVLEAVVKGRRQGIADVELLVHSTESVASAPYPDGPYGEALAAELSALPPAERATRLASEFEGLLSACPGAQEAFGAVANASPEQRCILLAVGLEESLPSCPFTQGDRVVTAVQVASQPPADGPITAIRFTVVEGGMPLTWAEGSWKDVVPSILEFEGKRVTP